MTLSTSGGFERNLVRGASLDDLDEERLREFLAHRVPQRLRDRLPPEQILERLGLAGRSGPQVLPSVAGLLAFGFHPQLFHPEWGVSAVKIDGRVISDPVVARDDIEGTIAEMVETSLVFISKHTRSIPNQIELAERAAEYVERAVREALVNALVHRDWSSTGRVALRVFDDRLELWSPGGPIPQLLLSLEELSGEGGVSLPRNPLLASLARYQGLGEQLGRGLPTLRRLIAESVGHQVSILASKTDVCVVIPSALHAREQVS